MHSCHRQRQHRGVRTTRLCRTLSCRSFSALPASTATRPTIVAIMIRPSCRDGMAIDMHLIWPSGKAKYFLFWGLTCVLKTRIGDLPVGSICRGTARLQSKSSWFDVVWSRWHPDGRPHPGHGPGRRLRMSVPVICITCGRWVDVSSACLFGPAPRHSQATAGLA